MFDTRRWGNFGRSDRRGALNFIDAATIVEATRLVRGGDVIPLNSPIDAASPNKKRRPYKRDVFLHHHILPLANGVYGIANDDGVEFSLQGSSHWDAFSHFGAIEPNVDGVYYGGAGFEETTPPTRGDEPVSKSLGIDAFGGAIVSRGVIIDLVRGVRGEGVRYLDKDDDVTRADIEKCLTEQELQLRRGDVVLLFTGFEARLAAGDVGGRDPGINASTVPLWVEKEIAAIAADNIAVESTPQPFRLEVHLHALRNAGIPLGELWALERLMEACRADGVYEFLLVSVPLNISGAFGSPANAVAIR